MQKGRQVEMQRQVEVRMQRQEQMRGFFAALRMTAQVLQRRCDPLGLTRRRER